MLLWRTGGSDRAPTPIRTAARLSISLSRRWKATGDRAAFSARLTVRLFHAVRMRSLVRPIGNLRVDVRALARRNQFSLCSLASAA